MLQALKRKRDFEKVKEQGVRWNTPCFTIVACEGFDENMLAIIASKKNLGKLAVNRNYVKRQIREIFYDAFKKNVLKEKTVYLAIPKKDFYTFSYSQKQEQLIWALRHIERQQKEQKV